MVHFYVAIIERGKKSFGAFFPDVPGCTSAGATAQEAAANAEQALQGHLTLCLEHGEALPEPTPLDQILTDPDVGGAAPALRRVGNPPPGRAVRVNITMPEDLLEAVDRFAKGHGYTRSGLLAHAARKHMKLS
jgi:predicted RNase H-like HicB family nuclease